MNAKKNTKNGCNNRYHPVPDVVLFYIKVI